MTAVPNMPISIGLPFYNTENFLADAIRSIFAQTYQDWELLLVDDGSTDRSLEIARSVNDPRVRVIYDGENKKLPSRLNQIAAEARYPLIGRMDADDLISPRRFEKQLAILDARPEIDLVTTGVFSVTDDLRPIGARWHYSNTITSKEVITKKGCGVVHAAILGRKSWFLRNPYNEAVKIAQDYELWARASAKNDFNIYLIQEPLYYYREQGNVTGKKMLAAYQNDRQMYWKYRHLGTLPSMMKSWCKSTIVKIFSATNQMDVLLKRRSKVVGDPTMLDLFQREIAQVLQTKVPGLD